MPKSFRPSFDIDWITFILTCLLSCIGLLFIFSATYTVNVPYSIFFKKQLLGICCGIFLYWGITFIDHRTLIRSGYFAYFAVVGLLGFTLIKGSIGMGAQRWLNLFFFKLQPSELAKPLFPAFVSYYFFTHKHSNTSSTHIFIPLLIILSMSFILITMQPDLGTALIVGFSGLCIFWFAHIPRSFFIYGFFLCIIATPVIWHILKPYQRNRIVVFFGYGTTHKERYQIEQAIIAIGSGNIYGKGLLQGTQTQLQFLPENRTDFIFAVLCEEWGFIGAFIILLIYIMLFFRIIYIIYLIEAPYLQLLAIGLLMHLLLSTIINIFMVIGLLPIVGIPLPLMSYGLANLLISFMSLGWIQNIYIQQQ